MIICIPYNKRLPDGTECVDVTSKTKSVFSPFILQTPWGLMENAWQYSKVYQCHLDKFGNIKDEWYQWSKEGMNSSKAVRYPMGKGALPIFSFWDNKRLSYIEARKAIYIPLYMKAVLDNSMQAFLALVDFYLALNEINQNLYIRDFDGYNRYELNMSLDDVINCDTKKMGHCFVLEKMILERA